MKNFFTILLSIIFIASSINVEAKKKKEKNNNDTIKSSVVSGLKFRSIGPAFTSGRIADFAVNPNNSSEYYVAVACGHIWKTNNSGTTWKAVFDNYGTYSIGCLAMDPNNHNVVWAGTGENNHQRALGYGNGVYKTINGGKNWKNMGLKESRQIGMITIDPRNSDIVFVAAEGSAWGPGGDRGLYKTIDGGKTWKKVLEISENTGVNNVVIDPCRPDIMYATSEQRRRHVHTKIGGGPESAIYKSTDGGNNWRKLKSGLPSGDVGGMGIAVSPINSDVIYAIIEAAGKSGGFYRSTDRGESWKKMGDHHSSGQYYNEIYCDPVQFDKVYSVETISKYTLDGGKTWKNIGNHSRHVDDHALWIDPKNTKHFLIGSDGGVYESFDAGKRFFYKSNLPVTQFYRVAVDNTEPFYWVYGGTQDNNSMGGPSRNLKSSGVESDEWVVTLGGDGFWQAIDPKNPDIVYSEYQYGNIYRYDKKSGESIKIKPQPQKDEDTYKWNWNSPFIISPHSNTRLYMGANKIFRSDDRGNTWKVISNDITAQIDRNTWPVMDRYWGVDAVVKDVSTSLYGMAVTIAESPVQEDLIFVGTDDGLIQISEDAGKNWRKIEKFSDVPEHTYVADIMPSKYDANIVFAAFDNRKKDDFKPYILKSEDKGKSWKMISSNLPKNGTVHTIEQDYVNPELLFVGTEFGAFFSSDGGKIWTQLKSGIPDVAVRDMVIQKRENDLVLATFGRGFYILDDYSPLRDLSKELLEKDAHIFPVKDALMYIQQRGKYGQGSTIYKASNPDFGATFTYSLKESPKTLKQIRTKKEKELIKDKKPIPIPSIEELRAEENEVKPHLIFTISDENGNVIRKIMKSASKGINRVTWNLRYPSPYPVGLKNDKYNPLSSAGNGMYVMPGKYYVSMAQYVRGELTHLVDKVEFNAVVLNNTTLPEKDRSKLIAFQKEISALLEVVNATETFASNLLEQTLYIKQTIQNTPGTSFELMKETEKLQAEIENIIYLFNGEKAKASSEEKTPAKPSINDRVGAIVWAQWRSTSAVTQTQKDQFDIVKEEFSPILEKLKKINNVDLKKLQDELEKINAPWTPGRIPKWKK